MPRVRQVLVQIARQARDRLRPPRGRVREREARARVTDEIQFLLLLRPAQAARQVELVADLPRDAAEQGAARRLLREGGRLVGGRRAARQGGFLAGRAEVFAEQVQARDPADRLLRRGRQAQLLRPLAA